MKLPATHYFVWYRVSGDVAAARTSVDALQREVASRTGIGGRLLTRAGTPPTWLEVYEGVGDPVAFEVALADAITRHGVVAYAPEGRHVEAFEETD
jgi:hypothetical protein